MRLKHTALAAMAVFTAATTDLMAQAKSDGTVKSTIDTDIPHYMENIIPYSCFDEKRFREDMEMGDFGRNRKVLMIYRQDDTGRYVLANIVKRNQDEIQAYVDEQHDTDPKREIHINQGPGRLVGLISYGEAMLEELHKPGKVHSYLQNYGRYQHAVISSGTLSDDNAVVVTLPVMRAQP